MRLSEEARVFIAGHRGLVGSALWRHFTAHGFRNLIGRTSRELDLRDARATEAFFKETRPDVVIAAAARVGGIAANAGRPAEFISDNLRIQVNLFDSAVANGVERFLFLGSSCIYPKARPATHQRRRALRRAHWKRRTRATPQLSSRGSPSSSRSAGNTGYRTYARCRPTSTGLVTISIRTAATSFPP